MDGRLWVIAVWEFKRYFKWKSELYTLLIMFALLFLTYGAQDLIKRLMSDDPVHIAILEQTGSLIRSTDLSDTDLLIFQSHSLDERTQLDDRLAQRELSGILILKPGEFSVQVYESAEWITHLRTQLTELLRAARLEEHRISPGDLESILAPVNLSVSYHSEGNPPGAGAEKWVAIIILGLMFIGVMTGFGLFFASITTEKQQRITEQVVSAASAQLWMDGKLLGITATSVKNMLTTGLIAVLGFSAVGQFTDWGPLDISLAGDPLVIVLFGILGLLFWNCFLAAIAATVSDPNTSTRTPLMLLPILPLAIGFSGLSQPNSLGMQIMSWFPLTSMGVMPIRLALGEVAFWEIALSLTLLAGATYLLRLLASRVFALSMLIYGKEPGWKEMWRWFRET